jgi:hypothetical protein
MEYDDSISSIDDMEVPDMHESYSVSSVQSAVSKKQKMKPALNREDPGYRKFIQYINNKRVEVSAYSTGITPRLKIRDAITGHRHHNYRVGSLNENLFFKVRMCVDNSNIKNNTNETTLFYDSPEQYERHMNKTIPMSIKEKWNIKYRNELAKYQ